SLLCILRFLLSLPKFLHHSILVMIYLIFVLLFPIHTMCIVPNYMVCYHMDIHILHLGLHTMHLQCFLIKFLLLLLLIIMLVFLFYYSFSSPSFIFFIFFNFFSTNLIFVQFAFC